jgi:SlyX protein
MEGIPEDRVVNLEIRFTHLERQVEELNEVVVRQQRLIDELAKRLSGVVLRVGELGDSPTNDRPPHY